MNRIRTNYILNTLAQILRILTPFITTPYVSRILGVYNIGIFSYSYSLQYYFSLFAVLGTAAYGTMEIAKDRDTRSLVSTSFWEIQTLRVFTSAVMLGIWAVVVSMQPENQIIFIILTSYIIASWFDISWLYAGLEKFPYIVARTITIRIIEVVAIFLFVKTSNDLPIYCLIMGGGTLIGNVTLWFNLNKIVDKVAFKLLRPFRHLKGTMIFFLPSIATTIYTMLDKTLIGVITKSNYENGIYEQATKVIEIAKAITFASLNTVLSPRSTYLYANKEYDKIKSNLNLSVGIMFAIGFAFAFGISGVADRFVPAFFGPGYDGVILLLRILSPIIIIITVSYSLGDQYYTPAGLRLKSSIYLLIGAGSNFVLNLLLIPLFNSAGAIIASLIAEFIITALYLINCGGYLKLKQIVKLAYKKLIAGILMLLFIMLLNVFVPDTVFGLVIIIILAGCFYFAALIILKDSDVLYVLREAKKFISKRKKSSN